MKTMQIPRKQIKHNPQILKTCRAGKATVGDAASDKTQARALG